MRPDSGSGSPINAERRCRSRRTLVSRRGAARARLARARPRRRTGRWLVERGMMRHIGAMPAPAIEVKDLVKRYPSAIAVDGISFAVAARRHHGFARRQRRRQDDDPVDPARPVVADLGHGAGARRGHSAPSLSGVAADEFFLAVCRPAASADGAPEPVDLCPALRLCGGAASGSTRWPPICRSAPFSTGRPANCRPGKRPAWRSPRRC